MLVCLCILFPTFDDYWYANQVHEHGYGGAQLWWYKHASSRYISSLIISCSYWLVNEPWKYRIVLFFIILLAAFSFRKVLSFFLEIDQNPAPTFNALFLIFCTFCITGIPGLSEVFFWLPGAATYLLGLVFLSIACTYLIKPDKSTKDYTLGTIFVIMSAGTSELGVIFIMATVSILILWKWQVRKSMKSIVTEIAYLGFMFLFFYLVILKAQGNELRATAEKTMHPEAGNLRFAINWGVLGGFKFIYNFLLIRQGWILAIASAILGLCINTPRKVSRLTLMITSLSQAVLISITIFITFFFSFSTGVTVLVPRTAGFLFLIWAVNTAIVGYLAGGWLSALISTKEYRYHNLASIIAILVVFWFYFKPEGNISGMWEEHNRGISMRYSRYQKEQRERIIAGEDGRGALPEPKKPLYVVWDLADKNYTGRYHSYYLQMLRHPTP